jgi:arylsulfatase A-like enzyme
MMDWFSTSLELAGVTAPSDRIIDGISLVSLFRNSTAVSDRCTNMRVMSYYLDPHARTMIYLSVLLFSAGQSFTTEVMN